MYLVLVDAMDWSQDSKFKLSPNSKSIFGISQVSIQCTFSMTSMMGSDLIHFRLNFEEKIEVVLQLLWKKKDIQIWLQSAHIVKSS